MGPDAWVEAAYAVFRDKGVDAVRIDPLAKRLKVTRGSFYWHFKNRDALLAAVLQKWEDTDTASIVAANEAGGGNAADRLLRLLNTCASDDGRLEIGIREWASRQQSAREIVERIDHRRIAYMTDLAHQAGVPRAWAHKRSRVAYIAWLGSYAGAVPANLDQRLADMKCLWEMVLADRKTPRSTAAGTT